MKNVRRSVGLISALMAMSLLAAACAPGQLPTATPKPTSTAEEGQMPESSQPTPSILPEWPGEAEQAVSDLAARLVVSPEDIEIISVTTQEMALSDLGCPPEQPSGTLQPDGIVLGKEVTLSYGEKTYVYHVYLRRAVLCEGDAPPASTGGTALPEASEAALEAARYDLTIRFGIADDEIEVVSVEKKTWSSAALGCPLPGKVYAQVITPGFVIVLRAKGQDYEYHTSLNSAVFCEQ